MAGNTIAGMAKKANPWGAKLKALRLSKRLSQAGAATYLEIPVATLRGWEQGRHAPPVYVRALVMRLLKQHG
jgi:DNA-binding transcriptional regulator YiaG